EWRDRTYVRGKKTFLNQFLFEFNLAYPMRRINFLRTKISDLASSHEYRDDALAQAKLLEIKKELNKAYKDLRKTARLLRSRQAPAKAGSTSAESEPSPAYMAIQVLKKKLAEETSKLIREDVRSEI